MVSAPAARLVAKELTLSRNPSSPLPASSRKGSGPACDDGSPPVAVAVAAASSPVRYAPSRACAKASWDRPWRASSGERARVPVKMRLVAIVWVGERGERLVGLPVELDGGRRTL